MCLILKDLKQKVELLENTIDSNENVLIGVGKAVHVFENEISQKSYEQVEYLEDIDHN